MVRNRSIPAKPDSTVPSQPDERFWPVAVVSLALGGCLVAAAMAYLGWEGNPWYGNSRTWVYTVPVSALLVIVLLRCIGSRLMRRSMQFSALACLLVHLWLFIASLETKVFGRLGDSPDHRLTVERLQELVIEPRYETVQLESNREELRKLFRPRMDDTAAPAREDIEPQPTERSPSGERQAVAAPEHPPAAEHMVERKQPTETELSDDTQEPSLARRLAEPPPTPDPSLVASHIQNPISSPQPPELTSGSANADKTGTPALPVDRPLVPPNIAPPSGPTDLVPQRVAGELHQPEVSRPEESAPNRALPRQPQPDIAANSNGHQASRFSPPPAIAPTRASASRHSAVAGVERPFPTSVETRAPGPAIQVPSIARANRSKTGEATVGPVEGTSIPRHGSQFSAAASGTEASSIPPSELPRAADRPLVAPGPALARQPQRQITERIANLGEPPSSSSMAAAAGGPDSNRVPSDATPERAYSGLQHSPSQLVRSVDQLAPRSPVSGMSAATAAEPPPISETTLDPGTALSSGAGRLVLRSDASSATSRLERPAPVELPKADGRSGLDVASALDKGPATRRVPQENLTIRPPTETYTRRDSVNGLEPNTTAAIPAEAFRRRAGRVSKVPATPAADAPDPQTEEAIERGLVFLAGRQLPAGNWSLQSVDPEVTISSDTAATGLALLSFQGAGYNHREHKYVAVVSSGLNYLLQNQKQNGDLYVPMDETSNRSAWLYSHGIAAIAVCEAYGMTHDPRLRQPAQRAVDFIAAAQDKDYGGWRYTPGSGADTSVSGWMMMALKSAELAELEVPARTYELVRRWLDAAQASRSEQHLYRYNPFAPDTLAQRHGRNPTQTMTAVGLLIRLYDGWRRDHPVMIQGADQLRRGLPDASTQEPPGRDTYYWYYGTQVMFHMRGKYWEDWQSRLHPMLVNSQLKVGPFAGSWDPHNPVPDRWSSQAGRLYVTTLNLLSLEVYYRHLPLYEDTAR